MARAASSHHCAKGYPEEQPPPPGQGTGGSGEVGCTGWEGTGDGYLEPNGHLQPNGHRQLILHLCRVWEPLSDQPRAQARGFSCLTSPEDKEPLTPSLWSCARGEDTGPATSSPSFSSPLRVEQLPAPAEAPPAIPRTDPLPTWTALGFFPTEAACRLDPGQGSCTGALPLHQARAGRWQHTAV